MSINTCRQNLGQLGEQLAARHYQQQGWQIHCRNYRTRYGELDLVLHQNNNWLIVEVKTRRSQTLGWGEESISPTKLKHLYLASQCLRQNLKNIQSCQMEICVIELQGKQASLHKFRL